MTQGHRSTNFPEVWGGIECTINRTEQGYFDQLNFSGHYTRWESDIEKFASLGIKALSYPVLWERHQPQQNQAIDWRASTASLDKIRACGMVPIVGLLHHGSGPSNTNLLDPDFPEKLAAYATQVAEQFPWVEYYTPVNEPLTTARFSGLYGLWFPHHKKETSFVRMLLNQLNSVVLCMDAIRKVNLNAKLVQTEDLSKTYSTPLLRFQADFENERRWLTFDLLSGKVDKNLKMVRYMHPLGIRDADLQFFKRHPCPPDIMGLNYYLTSERFLDEKLENYPTHTHGGNEVQQYADVEAVRVMHDEPWGLKVLLKEAWSRFKIPLAMTECHLHCSREEQVRWLASCWKDLQELREESVDIRALTAWALLGSYGWEKLLTSPEMKYESGVFDVRSGEARETALAGLLRMAASSETIQHQFCNVPGWWAKENLFLPKATVATNHLLESVAGNVKPLLIIGKNGTLARAFAHICTERKIPHFCAGRKEVDILNNHGFDQLLRKLQPWAVINTAGYVNIDRAENETEECVALNTAAPVLLARLCNTHGIPFMTFSTDQVFDGTNINGYGEHDAPGPLNTYGKSKADQEEQVLAVHATACIIRTSAFFGPWDNYNFVHHVIESLKHGSMVEAVSDVYVSPTYVPDLVDACLNMLIDGEAGLFHFANQGIVSWAAFARQIARMGGYDTRLIKAISSQQTAWVAKRPKYAGLVSKKGTRMPHLTDSLQRFFEERAILVSEAFPAELGTLVEAE